MENFISLSILVTLNPGIPLVHAIPGRAELYPSSSAYTKVVNTVQPLLTNCQCIVFTSFSEPTFTLELAQQIIQRAAEMERPLQIHAHSFSFRCQSYNGSKHEAVELVFLYVSPVGPSIGILNWEHPLILEGDLTYAHLYPFLLVYLVDDSYLRNAKWSEMEYRACRVLQNIIYLQFWSLHPYLPVYKYALLLYRCGGDPFCTPMLESVTVEEPVYYEPVMKELRMQRSNFHGYAVAVRGPGN